MLDLLGDQAVDVYLNDVAYWRCVPAGVWSYTIGGYQVMKKRLSYREKPLLGRDLKRQEVREVMRMARRITARLAAATRAGCELSGMRLVKGGLLLEPSTEWSPSLEELLSGVTESNLHDEVDTGAAQGSEAW